MSQSVCPFCQQENQCQAEQPGGCWCFREKVPNELQALVPDELKRKACICQLCVASFKLDPSAFKARHGQSG